MAHGDYFDAKPWGAQIAAVIKSRDDARELIAKLRKLVDDIWNCRACGGSGATDFGHLGWAPCDACDGSGLRPAGSPASIADE